MFIIYKRYENETDEELIYRICSNKSEIGSWNEVANILNDLLDKDFDESAYRKKYQSFKKMFEANQSKFTSDEEILNEIKNQRRELEKGRVKFRDERNEYKRLIREQARKESFEELLLREVKAFKPDVGTFNIKLDENNKNEGAECAVIIHLTDVHAGIDIKNFANEFNWDILKQRLYDYANEIKKIIKRHNPNEVLLILGGDLISGLIHNNLRLENNTNVIQQTINVAELISEFIFYLISSCVKCEMKIGLVAGNHSRINPEKEFNAKGENFEWFILPYLKAKFQYIKKIQFIDNTIDESIGSTVVCDQLIYFTHGDKDKVKDVVHNLTLFTGNQPNFIFMGHRHTNGYTTCYNTKVIESGCVSGADNYCMNMRLRNYPEQTVSIINRNGLECIYDITLNNGGGDNG